MNNYELAPIGISVYKRLDHLKKTILALKNNLLSDKSDLFIFSDAPIKGDENDVSLLRKYLKTINGFKSVTIIERKTNNRIFNGRMGHLSLLKKFGKCIFLEEDIVTSIGFLTFMNQALFIYKDNPNILNITGYSPPIDKNDISEDYFLFKRYIAWGVGTWLDKFEKVVEITEDDYNQTILPNKNDIVRNCGELAYNYFVDEYVRQSNHFDIRASFLEYKDNLYTLFPTESLVFNIGHDGSGVNCGITNKFDVDISKKTTFDLPNSPIQNNIIKQRLVKFFTHKELISKLTLEDFQKKAKSILTNDKLVIWGTNHISESITKSLTNTEKSNVLFYIDSFSNKGQLFYDKQVLLPELGLKEDIKNILIASISSRKFIHNIIKKYNPSVNCIMFEAINKNITQNIAETITDLNISSASIWGIDNISRAFKENKTIKNLQINHYIDSFPKSNQQYNGKAVITPVDAVKNGEKNIIILSLNNAQEMKQQLLKIDPSVNCIMFEAINKNITQNIAETITDLNISSASIWGIDNISRAFKENKTIKNLQINHYIDSFPKSNQQYNGKAVITPVDAVKNGEKNIIILSLNNAEEMKQQLLKIDPSVNCILPVNII